LTALRKHGFLEEAPEARDWRTAAAAFARSCHVDLRHAEHVRGLALTLFEALATPFGLGGRARDLLEAAALLHDVGYFISYAKHHKHSYHLVRHADLRGFSPREKEIIANVARYHRKALPKQKHDGFGQLGEEDRTLVRRLGGLLRLADGLDRRRVGQVQTLRCTLGGAAFHVGLEGKGDVSVELFGGREKGDLFELAFRRRLVLGAEGGLSLPAGDVSCALSN
jgi:exopolyphosphatase/guanosine-5'-triphosphate,3'-diphosphate pyrophosphatase